MSLVRYFNPNKELRRIHRNFDNFADNTDVTYLAPIDLMENEDEYTIQVSVPGYSKDEIVVEADFERVTITAEREQVNEEENSELTYLLKERSTRKLSRSVRFRKPINPGEAKTTLENGVLTVIIPKSEEAKSVNLTIN